MLPRVGVDVPCARPSRVISTSSRVGTTNIAVGIRLDTARSEAAAASLRHDVWLARFVRPIVRIDIIRISLRLDLRRTLRRQSRASEVGGETAKAARSAGIEPHPSALSARAPSAALRWALRVV